MIKKSLPHTIIASVLALLLLPSLLLSLTNTLVSFSSDQTPAAPFIYRVNLSIHPKAVYMLNDHEVFIVGDLNGSAVAEVLNITSPFNPPTVIQTYPMVGSVSAVATNGYPVERIAVGTDEGDLALFKVSGGRIYLLLQSVLGTDYPINKLLILKGSTDYKVAALTGRRGGGVCTTCHIYVFDEASGNALRIGPGEGNATLSISNVLPQDIAGALTVGKEGFFYDARYFVVTWLPTKFYSLIINVTYREVINATLLVKPAANALIKLVIYNTSTHTVFNYGVNANSKGLATVAIPLGYSVNLSVSDLKGGHYGAHVTPENVTPLGKAYVALQLNATPITLPANLLYKTPPYELAVPHIINVDNVPKTFKFVTTLDDAGVNPAATGLTLLKGDLSNKYILHYYDPSDGSLIIKSYDLSFKPLNTVKDVVGSNLKSLGAFTYPDEKIVLSAFQEGKVKSYIASGSKYVFYYELVVGGKINRFQVIPASTGYYYFIHSTNGMQVVTLYPYQLPIFRVGTKISFAEGSVDSYLTKGLDYGVIAYPNYLLIMEHVSGIIASQKPVDLSNIMAPSLKVLIKAPQGLGLNGTSVTLVLPGNETVVREVNGTSSAELVFPNMIPGLNYTLIVKSPKQYVTAFTKTFQVTNYSDIEIPVKLVYKIFSLRINVMDNLTGRPPTVPYDVFIDGKEVASKVNESSVLTKAVYGNHIIEVKPAKGYEGVYAGTAKNISLVRNSSVTLRLSRIKYPLQIVVADKISKLPLSPIEVIINGSLSKVISYGGNKAVFQLPYGHYSVVAKPVSGYESIYLPTQAVVFVNKPVVYSLVILRKEYNLTVKLVDKTVGKVIAPFNVYVNGTLAASNVKNEATIRLPYGTYEVSVSPSPGHAGVYTVPRPKLVKVVSNASVTYPLVRKFYKVKVLVTDDQGVPLKDAQVTFYSVDKGGVISTLITDNSGTVYNSLFYGGYRITASAKGFYSSYKDLVLNRDTDLKIVLQPMPLTIVIRFLPVIAVIIIAIVAVVVALKIKAKIAERLPEQELF